MRRYLGQAAILFNTKFVGYGAFVWDIVRLNDGQTLETDHLILAIGHSARDTYQSLLDQRVAIGPKPFAIGARFEHPQEVIDQIQFGSCTLLPAAEYKLAARQGERGIWTFCMCPGGQLLPTNAQAEHLAINGMSYHALETVVLLMLQLWLTLIAKISTKGTLRWDAISSRN